LEVRKVQKELEEALSREHVLASKQIPERYLFDALRPYRPYPRLRKHGYVPTFLVRPKTAQDVSAVVRIARQARLPIVPYGSGTGLMGAAIAARGGIMVDTTGMNQITQVNEEDMMVEAEPGVVLEKIFEELDQHSLFFAHDPWTRPVATLGGATSTNSLGYLGAKYGSFGNQLLGLEAVLSDGRSFRTRPAQFSSTGLDLRRLFVGTEGTFGFVTSATVRAFPKPEKFALAAYSFPNFQQGYRTIAEMRKSGVVASMIDFGEENPGDRAPSLLNLAFDGLEGEVDAHAAKTDRIAQAHQGQRSSNRDAQEFWDHRHDIALMYQRRISKKLPKEEPRTKYDYIHISLPASKILDFRREVLRIGDKSSVSIDEVGLWQGPELFSIVASSRAATPKAAALRLWHASDDIIRYAQGLGGCMEFCHGVGLKLAHLMEREHGLGLEVMRRLKHAVDPLGTMNPGKADL
jgi:FAD/FMN-containing dehydrogenase